MKHFKTALFASAFGLLSATSLAHSFFADYDTHLKDDPFGENRTAPVDYYMLSLSYSPSFCAATQRKYGEIPANLQYQCNPKAHFGWVVHGLWPQNGSAKRISDHPRFCQGDLPPLPEKLIEQYLPISPGKKLLQGEWEKHGACAFRTASDYFYMEKALFNSLKLPPNKPNKRQLIAYLKQHNPQLKHVFIRVSRSEIHICYNKKWRPIDCQR